MARFDMAVNSPGMDSRMKLLEMMHWFAGNTGEVVDYYAASLDSDIAYATVQSELTLFMAPLPTRIRRSNLGI